MVVERIRDFPLSNLLTADLWEKVPESSFSINSFVCDLGELLGKALVLLPKLIDRVLDKKEGDVILLEFSRDILGHGAAE